MNNLKSSQLAVAKVCHEIANHLSVIKFIQEDLSGSNVHEARELLKTVDLLTHTMDFFRNIYATSGGVSSIREVLLNIFKLKDVTLSDNENVFSNISNNFENVICGILYVVMKICKVGDIIDISREKDGILVTVPEGRFLSKNVVEAFNNSSVEEDIFNIFVSYIKQIADLGHFKITLGDQNKTLKVVVWEK